VGTARALGFIFAPNRAERSILLGGLGSALLAGALSFGGNQPGMARWVLITVLAVIGLTLCVLALRRRGAPAGLPHMAVTAVVLSLAGLGSIAVLASTLYGVTHSDIACRDDTTVATVVGAAEIRAGHNPYQTYDEIQALAQTCGTLSGTPLRTGEFAGAQSYPTTTQIQRAARDALSNPATSAIERRLSYPAGALLLGVAGETALVLGTVVALAAAAFAVVRKAARGARLAAALAVLAQTSTWTVIDSGHPDGVAIGLSVLAWLAPSPLAGAALLGAACAVKQTTWFLVLPFLVTVWRRDGWRPALLAGGVAGLVFGAINAPFVVLSPAAWLHSLLAPMVDPLFPSGDGLVAPLTNHGFTPGSMLVLSLALGAATLVAALLALRRGRSAAGVAAITGGLALWFGDRSLPQYFIGIGLLAVALIVSASREHHDTSLATSVTLEPQPHLATVASG